MIPGITTPKLTLNGYKGQARLVDIIDGDTVYLVIPFLDNYFKFNTRVSGIDTPEKHGKTKEIGEAATAFSCTFFTGLKNLSRADLKTYLDLVLIIVVLDNQ